MREEVVEALFPEVEEEGEALHPRVELLEGEVQQQLGEAEQPGEMTVQVSRHFDEPPSHYELQANL